MQKISTALLLGLQAVLYVLSLVLYILVRPVVWVIIYIRWYFVILAWYMRGDITLRMFGRRFVVWYALGTVLSYLVTLVLFLVFTELTIAQLVPKLPSLTWEIVIDEWQYFSTNALVLYAAAIIGRYLYTRGYMLSYLVRRIQSTRQFKRRKGT